MRLSLEIAALVLASLLLLVLAELGHALLPLKWQAGHTVSAMLLHGLVLALALVPMFSALLRQQARMRAALAASERQRDEALAREARLASGLNSGDFVVYDWCLSDGEILVCTVSRRCSGNRAVLPASVRPGGWRLRASRRSRGCSERAVRPPAWRQRNL